MLDTCSCHSYILQLIPISVGNIGCLEWAPIVLYLLGFGLLYGYPEPAVEEKAGQKWVWHLK